MAEQTSAEDTGTKTARKAKKQAAEKAPKAKKTKANGNGADPGVGHNSSELTANLAKYLSEMDKIKDDQEKMNGEFAVDIGNVKEKYANATGHTRKHLTKIYTKHRRELKEELARIDMEQKDRDVYDELERACVALPLFGASAARAQAEKS